MKRIFFILFTLTFTVYGNTQIINVNNSLFPKKISFEWREYSLVERNKQDFSLVENDLLVTDFEFLCLPKDNIEQRNKTVLFLWEDMAIHVNLYDVTKKILLSFMEGSSINSNDKFNVATYNRMGNNKNALSMLSNFTSDRKVLSDKINAHRPSTELFKEHPYKTDIYRAIEDGLDILSRENESDIKAIVVITAGYNLFAGGGKAVFPTDKAITSKVPVFVIHYYRDHGGLSDLTDIELRKTCGDLIKIETSAEATPVLLEWYKSLDTRVYGFHYKFSYTPIHRKRDGSPLNLYLSINNREREPVGVHALPFSWRWWISENLPLFIGLIILLLAIILATIILIRKYITKKNAEQEKINREQAERIQKAQGDNELIKNENKRIQDELALQKVLETAKKEEEHRNGLIRQMQIRNLYPRLVGNVNGKEINYTINKHEISIGWANDNDFVLPFDTVSSHHAKIVFNGENFEIFDLESTNHVIVNGKIVTQKSLKNTDMIGLGEVILTIFI